ncbi:MAG: hypothetical protein DSZ05_09325 [Sulfurospirillum sp.]|nr:MAG: hypothetical protein DSZ05_09325 [Sulfurospirillum sp.]
MVLMTSLSQAMEFRISSGTFNWEMGMPFMKADFDLDSNIYSISEQHNNFGDSRIYYFYNADIYQSDTMDKMTTFVTRPLTQRVPFFGSFNDAVEKYTSIPVPADYKIRGFDLNLGIGYDLFHDAKGVIGVGVNTGLSLPVMKMTNMQKSAKLTYNLLDKTDTTIKTWKLGPVIHANYEIAPKFMVYGSFSAGIQTGTIENDWVKSSFDVDGSYTTLDLGGRYTPWSSTKDLGWIRLDPKLFFTVGYSYKKWDMDEAKVNTFNIAEFSSGGIVKTSFDTSYFYLGVGYDF